jgi:hypothetical protein
MENPMLSVRNLVFAGALLAVVPFAAVGQEPKAAPRAMPPATGPAPAPIPTPVAGAPNSDCAPTTRKVCKMVPTMVAETRTVMKPVQKTECYTAYREETVQEKKMVTVTTHKTEHYTEMVTKTCCVKVPCYEEKTCMEKHKKVEWVTEYKTKCHVCFHKECKTIGGCGDGCGNGCGSGCCGDKCGGGGGGCCKGGFSFPVYKPEIHTEVVACKVPKCTYECVPVTKKVCTYKTEMKTTCVPVCKTRCVPCTEQKEVVCCKKVCVPYQATRCVTVCEQCTETVNVCKMVPTWVEEACPPAAPVAQAPCAQNQAPCAQNQGCNNGCNNGCGNGCGNGCCFSGCCDKLKSCCSGCCDKFQNCCGKIKGCFCCK